MSRIMISEGNLWVYIYSLKYTICIFIVIFLNYFLRVFKKCRKLVP